MDRNALFDVIIVLGYPGSGKGTQCNKIEKVYNYHHISAGYLLQKETLNPQMKYGEIIKSHRSKGTIVPHEITCKLILQEMKASQKSNRFVIDGFPRNEDNLIGWKSILEKHCSLQCVLFIDCSEEVSRERCLQRKRDSADSVDVIDKRLKQFNDETRNVLEKFGILVRKINGNQDTDKVFEDIQLELKTLLKK